MCKLLKVTLESSMKAEKIDLISHFMVTASLSSGTNGMPWRKMQSNCTGYFVVSQHVQESDKLQSVIVSKHCCSPGLVCTS